MDDLVTSSSYQQTFARTYRLICRFLPPSFDREAITQDIILKCLEKQTPVSFTIIRNQCSDVYRKSVTERRVNEIVSRGLITTTNSSPSPDAINELSYLIETTDLSPKERLVIWNKYYKSLTDREIARDLQLSKLRVRTLRISAISKLKQKALEQELGEILLCQVISQISTA